MMAEEKDFFLANASRQDWTHNLYIPFLWLALVSKFQFSYSAMLTPKKIWDMERKLNDCYVDQDFKAKRSTSPSAMHIA